jgi:hypothetical protein
MVHPALIRALGIAHVEELKRAADVGHTIRSARRVAHTPHAVALPIAIVRSATTPLRGRRAPQAGGTTSTETSQEAPWACPPRRRRTRIADPKPHENRAGVRRK